MLLFYSPSFRTTPGCKGYTDESVEAWLSAKPVWEQYVWAYLEKDRPDDDIDRATSIGSSTRARRVVYGFRLFNRLNARERLHVYPFNPADLVAISEYPKVRIYLYFSKILRDIASALCACV